MQQKAHSEYSITPAPRGGQAFEFLDAALYYAAQGWPVLPLKPKGKTPLTRHGVKDATTDEAQITKWWTKWPDANIGIATGKVSGFFVLDVDPRNGGNESLRDLEKSHKVLPGTATQVTGGGGLHILLRYPNVRIKSGAHKLGPGLDIKADGGYIVAAPSIHESGKSYVWADGWPTPRKIADPPAWLIEMIKDNRPTPTLQHVEGGKAFIPEGQRNDKLTQYAGLLRRWGWSSEQIFEELIKFNQTWARPPLPESEIKRIAESVGRYRPGPNEELTEGEANYLNSLPPTDFDNARAIAYLYADVLRYDTDHKRWLIWDGFRWREAQDGEILEIVADVAEKRYLAASKFNDADKQKTLMHWALKSKDQHRIDAAIKYVKQLRPIAVRSEDLDKYPHLLGVKNGAVDLENGKLINDPKFLITKSTGVEYDPHAVAPRWERFLREIFEEDDELIRFVQIAIGYTLTGYTDEHVLFLLHGTGANGKSVFLRTLRHVLGDYARVTSFATFLVSKPRSGGDATPDLAALEGARLVIASEVKEGRRLDTARIKSLTGGDPITARPLYSKPITFVPQFKIWAAVNHLPIIRESGAAIWRRIRVIPFRVQFPPDKADKKLFEKLKTEAKGILRWAVEGAQMWHREGLPEAGAIYEATREYQSDEDILGEFIAERCIVDATAWVQASQIYQAYVEWCHEIGERPMSRHAFKQYMEAHGIKYKREKHGRYYIGIGLLDEVNSEDTER